MLAGGSALLMIFSLSRSYLCLCQSGLNDWREVTTLLIHWGLCTSALVLSADERCGHLASSKREMLKSLSAAVNTLFPTPDSMTSTQRSPSIRDVTKARLNGKIGLGRGNLATRN